jgi:hypothetical protein
MAAPDGEALAQDADPVDNEENEDLARGDEDDVHGEEAVLDLRVEERVGCGMGMSETDGGRKG